MYLLFVYLDPWGLGELQQLRKMIRDSLLGSMVGHVGI